VFGLVDVVIVVPFAWLAIGAVVYGYDSAPLPPPGHRLYQRAARKVSSGPRAVRRVVTDVGADLSDRFAPLLRGLRLLLHTGRSSMLLFWLAFLIAQTAPQWLWELERLLVGPRDLGLVWAPLSGPLGVVNDAIGSVLVVCLLAAVVERAMTGRAPAPPETDQPPVSRA